MFFSLSVSTLQLATFYDRTASRPLETPLPLFSLFMMGPFNNTETQKAEDAGFSAGEYRKPLAF
jgi:hypothetical protein